jgi:predicted adenine nucleotide alpha hydrolase (AANH) superfamily ATPase
MGEKLLIDACCGPCSLIFDHEVDLDRSTSRFLFYNPNVHPWSEYQRRLEAFLAFMDAGGFNYEVLPWSPEDWIRAVSFREENRCEMCYRLRLRRTADYAMEEGFGVFTTTLLASPWQDHEMLGLLGGSIATSRGQRFLTWDGRQYYHEGLREARSRGLYTQPWCGCIFSERERYDKTRREAGPGRPCA